MDDKEGFNQATIPWRAPDLAGLDLAGAPDHAADSAAIAAYRRDGVVLLEGAFTDWVEALRAGLERNLAEPSRYRFPCESNPAGAPGRFFDSYCNWDLIPEYRDFVCRSEAASMAGRFTGAARMQIFHEHAFVKEPGTQRATPWHQDISYYCVEGGRMISVYVALDHADADVAVRFVKGSHRWGKLYYPRIFMDGTDFNTMDEALEPVPDIDGRADEFDLFATALAPGDAILFDFRTLHGATDATLKARRRALSTRWIGEDVRYCRRPGETSPPLPDSLGLSPGDAMPEDWFPVIWRRR